MLFPKICAVVFLLLTIVFSTSGQKSTSRKIEVTQKDKSEIIKQVFNDGFEKLIDDKRFSQCTIPLINDEQIILVKTDEQNIFPKAMGVYRFKFLSEKKIEAEIKSNDGDCYFQINRLAFTNKRKATVTLWRWIEVVTVVNGKSWYPSRWVGATGRVYKATKEKGKWLVKFSNGTAIVS